MSSLSETQIQRRSLLAIETKRIGDLILTAPALDAWKLAYPDGHITLLAQDLAADAGEMIQSVDDTVVVKAGNTALWKALLGRSYTECVDFTGTDRGMWLAAIARAKRKVTFRRFKQLAFREKIFSEWVDSSVQRRHTIDHHFDLVVPLLEDEQIPVPPLDLRVPEAAGVRCDTALARLGIRDSFFLVHPCSARREKMWPTDRWSAVIEHAARESGLQPVIVSSPAANEVAQAREIAKLTRMPCVVAAGSFDLQSLAALISRATFQVGLDSAPMHLASAFHIPQVVLFGPTNPFQWRPLQGLALVVSGGVVQDEFFPKIPPVSMEENHVHAMKDAVDRLLHLLQNSCGAA